MQKYVDFEKTPNGNLKIVLRFEGRDFIQERMDDASALRRQGSLALDLDLLEYQLCNGWEVVSPEECGAMTDALIISDDVERDEDGKIIRFGRVYSDINYYQLESTSERLMRLDFVEWFGTE